jgi:hypothetical protein
MEKKQLAYAEMVKDGTYQVKVGLAGYALPHVFSDVFSSEEDANLWIRSNAGQDRIHEIRNKYNKWKARRACRSFARMDTTSGILDAMFQKIARSRATTLNF